LVLATAKKITYWLPLFIALLISDALFASPPEIKIPELKRSGYISPYPAIHSREPFIYSLNIESQYNPRLRTRTNPKVIRSDFDANSLTFSGYYYKRGRYSYEFIPRSVDAETFYNRRIGFLAGKQMNESRAKVTKQALTKQKKGPLELRVNIDSPVLESIAGEGGVGLKVSGTHQISFSGRSSWDNKSTTTLYQQSKFPSLNMEQISRFTINGTIGSKISVSVTQDSKVNTPLANRLMIRYKGDEDDIIKTIEAGNTTLSLPNTQFVGYSARIQGLFGIKAEAQIGGLKLITIASQEKGSTETTSLDANDAGNKARISDYQFYDGKIYDLGRESDFNPGDRITKFILYQSIDNFNSNNSVIGTKADMYVNPLDSIDLYPLEKTTAEVVEMSQDDYIVDFNEHWIILKSPVQSRSQKRLAVWMEISDSLGNVVSTVGNLDTNVYQLKLIKHEAPDTTQVTWNYMWRNVYNLRTGSNFSSADLDLNGLEIRILEGDPKDTRLEDHKDYQEDGNSTPFIQVLGLDQKGNSNEPIPDNLVDIYDQAIVDPYNSLLIFPNRTPFNNDVSYIKDSEGNPVTLDTKVPEIYKLTYANTNVQTASKYYIEVSSKTRASEISLRKSNIIEGSEKVTLNGQTMVKGTDYDIYYDYGKIKLLTDEMQDPNSDLSVDFEYAPFILAQKKTLFGVRGEYELNNNFKFGSTFLYKSDKATDRKPKLGQETSTMMVWDIDGKMSFKPNFITSMFDALPFLSTEAQSSLSITAEMAQSYPNPNIDGTAYIDDFEGSRDAYSFGVYRQFWKFASQPSSGLMDVDSRRARLLWYNPYEQVVTTDIWEQDIGAGQGLSHVLNLIYFPDAVDRRAGKDTILTDTLDASKSWGGIMRSLPVVSQENAQLLELRVKGDVGILHIDLGSMTEDIDGDGEYFDEDTLNGGYRYSFIESEDVGLDGMTDAEERIYYGEEGSDPSGDNWTFDVENIQNASQIDYSRINGTQGNINDPETSGRADSEDLDNDGVGDFLNNYFSFRINLADQVGDNRFLVDSSRNPQQWKTYRIPLRDTTALSESIGLPSWSNISYVRLWIQSPDQDTCRLSIATIDIISSNWEDTVIAGGESPSDDPVFSVAVINDKESVQYTSPPGVDGFYNSSTGVTETEQSLSLHFENFRAYDSTASDTGIAQRYLLSTVNMLGYKRLEMFVHGPDAATADSLLYFFRVGTDSVNFYEFSQILKPGWADNDLVMEFEKITELKEFLNKAKADDPDVNSYTDTVPEGVYKVYGKPDITRVKYLASGIANLDTSTSVTGDVWIDELRVTEVRRDVGLAARITAGGNAADLFSYSIGYSHENEFFRKISSSTKGGSNNNLGSGKASNSYNYSIRLKLERFLPKALGAKIPISYRFQKSTSRPMLKSGSDIFLSDSLRNEQSTISSTKSFTISESFSKKTRNPLFTVLLNPLKFNFSISRSDGKSPTIPKSMNESVKYGGTYNLSISKPPNITPFFWTKPIPLLNKLSENKFYLFPNTFNLQGNINRSLRITRNANDILSNSYTKDFKGTFKTGYRAFDNMSINFSMNSRRDLSDPKYNARLGLETNYGQNFGISYNPSLFPFLTHKGSYSTSFREDLNISNFLRGGSLTKSYNLGGTFDHKKLFGGSGRSARGRPGGTRGRGGKKANVIKAGEDKKPLFSFLKPVGKVMLFLTGWVNPLGYDFKETYSYTLVNLSDRPQMKFRLGFTDDIGVEQDTTATSSGRSNKISKSTSYSLRSGTTFFGGLKTDVAFSRSIRQDVKTTISPQKHISTNFPDINFTLRNFTTFRFMNAIKKKFNPRFKYGRSKDETIDINSNITKSDKISTNYNPLIAIDFVIIKGLKINFKTSKTIVETNSYSNIDGSLNNKSTSTQNNSSLSTKYSFSWPRGVKIPIFGRLKIKSTMSFAISITKRNQINEGFDYITNLPSKRERNDLMISPSISYSFSSQIKGGLTGRWQDTEDKSLSKISHVRELRIWVDIRF